MTLAFSSEGTLLRHKLALMFIINFPSLPTNIEHLELTRMLSDHLSGHPEVQTIKVVRDSKGGTCAFIQCQVRLLLPRF